MRMSCNGCRVLRKGCSESCSIRPCLQWIKNPESQANATVFLAKFYGRAGLLNLINAGPEHLRPAIFRSLLYEACGRIVNPIYGSVGLLWSGSWHLCQAAVEAVLKGAPIAQLTTESAAGATPPMKAYDIRHVSKAGNPSSQELHQVKTRSRFKRSPRKPKAELASEPTTDLTWGGCVPRAPSHDSSLSHQSELNAETESAFSVETIEASLASRADLEAEVEPDSRADDELELRLGFVRVAHAGGMRAAENVKVQNEADGCGDATCRVNLGLDLSC